MIVNTVIQIEKIVMMMTAGYAKIAAQKPTRIMHVVVEVVAIPGKMKKVVLMDVRTAPVRPVTLTEIRALQTANAAQDYVPMETVNVSTQIAAAVTNVQVTTGDPATIKEHFAAMEIQ